MERSATPGLQTGRNRARGARDSPQPRDLLDEKAVARFAGSFLCIADDPGVPLRSTPRLYAVATLRGLNATLHHVVQRFLQFVAGLEAGYRPLGWALARL